MAVPTPKDIVKFIELLPIQYRDSADLNTLLNIYLEQVQSLEDANQELSALSTDIETAFGYQLDIIGKLQGALREGRTDEEYRVHIKITSAVNHSKGTPENILSILSDLTGSANVMYWEHYPASIYLYLDGVIELDPLVKDTVSKMLPAGCSVGYIGFSDNPLVSTPYDQEYTTTELISDTTLPISTNTIQDILVKVETSTDNLPKSYLAESVELAFFNLVDETADTFVDEVGDLITVFSEDDISDSQIHGILAESI